VLLMLSELLYGYVWFMDDLRPFLFVMGAVGRPSGFPSQNSSDGYKKLLSARYP
jgi:hypothetical protein